MNADVTSVRLKLIDAGWNPVPVSPINKACYLAGWQTIDTSEFHIENWDTTNPAHSNTGLVTNRTYFGIDADARDKPLADRIVGAAFEHCGPTPFIRVGRAPKTMLVYQKEAPSSIITSRYKFLDHDGDGLEILSGSKGANGAWSGAVFTAFGIHPDTRKPYRWVGEANPLEDTPADAPLVTQAQVDAFIETVRGFAPFAVGRDGKANPDAPRSCDADGLVVDGRENLLRDCIMRTAREAYNANEPLEARGIAGRGWEIFIERASLSDGEWTFRDALGKAGSTIRRIRSGALKISRDLAQAETFFFADDPATSVQQLRKLLTGHLDKSLTTFWEPAYALA